MADARDLKSRGSDPVPVRSRSPAPYRGVEQLAARRAHNPEVAGSSPASATIKKDSKSYDFESFLRLFTVLNFALIFAKFVQFGAGFALSGAASSLRNGCERPKSTAPSTPSSLSSFGKVTRRSTLFQTQQYDPRPYCTAASSVRGCNFSLRVTTLRFATQLLILFGRPRFPCIFRLFLLLRHIQVRQRSVERPNNLGLIATVFRG